MASTTDCDPRPPPDSPVTGKSSFCKQAGPETVLISGPRVLLIDDDPDVALVLQRYFQRSGIQADVAHTGAEAVALKRSSAPDIVLVDLELPDVDGSALIRWLRAEHDCGIIVVSGSGDEATRVLALELGADDYVSKPPSLPELVARVRAVHRRMGERGLPAAATTKRDGERPIAWVGGFAIDLQSRQIRDPAGKLVNLTAAEFAVLAALIEANGEPVARERLSEIALHRPGHSEDRGVDQLVFGLRQKLAAPGDRRRFIQSIRNGGYRLSEIHQDH